MNRFRIGLSFIAVLIPASAFAHAPSAIMIKAQDGRLMIQVQHNVRNPADHFVGKISIKLNGKKIVDQEFIRQTDTAMQRAEYLVPGLKSGDKVDVEADCNQYGDKKQSITVE